MRTPTPAGLALLGAGIQPKQLAKDLGITGQGVSYHLAGKTAKTSPELIEAIERRGGAELAATVARLIDEARELRRSA